MADYIHKNILLQAYVHIEVPGNLTAERLEQLRLDLKQFAEARGRFFIYPEVEIELEFKDGSLKSYLSIAGAIYLAIAGYGDFRSGVDYLYTDIKRLSDTLVAESLFATKAKHKQVIRTEARVGIVGSLKDLVDQLNALDNSIGVIPVEDVTARIQRIQHDAETLIRNVRAKEDAEQIEQELLRTAIALPTKPPYPKDKKPSEVALRTYSDVLASFRKRFRPKRKKP